MPELSPAASLAAMSCAVFFLPAPAFPAASLQARPGAVPIAALPAAVALTGWSGPAALAAPVLGLQASGLAALPQVPTPAGPHAAPPPAAAPRPAQVPVEDILRESDVILWGESHFSLSALDWLAANLLRLKAAGITQLAFENLELSAEPGLRDYLAGRRGDVPEEAFFDYRREAIQALFEAAKSAGVGIIAMQKPYLEWFEEIVKLASRHPGVPPAILSDPEAMQRFISRADYRRIPGLNEAVAEVAMTRRNRFMASRLREELRPGEKALVLAGYAHLKHPEGLGVDSIFGVPAAPFGNLADELADIPLRTFSVSLTGGEFPDEQARALDQQLKAAAYRRLAETGNDPRHEVFLRTSERSAIFHMGGGRAGPEQTPQRQNDTPQELP